MPRRRARLARRHAILSLSVAVLLSVAAAITTRAQEPGPGDVASAAQSLRVWLITIGPGDQVWERYGHNALRFQDARTGRDVAYNWGIFSFEQVDFIPRFLQGRMLYSMAAFPTHSMVDMYARDDREVVFQELALTGAQTLEAHRLATQNAQPENRDYIYQYFLDNCSTRIRDLLDQVLDGQLRDQFDATPSGTSYRFHARRLTEIDPLIYTGQDFLLGTPTDTPITAWGEMFVPMTLRDALRDVTVVDEQGRARPLVRREEVVAPSGREPEPDAPPAWLPAYVAIGLVFGGVLGLLGRARSTSSRWSRRLLLTLGTVWSLTGGLLGCILVLLLFTDHTFSYWNENLFLFNPVMLGLGVLLPLSGFGARWRARARTVALVLAVVALLGLLWQLAPVSRHQNAMFFALALPAHVALAWALGRQTSDHTPSNARADRGRRTGSAPPAPRGRPGSADRAPASGVRDTRDPRPPDGAV